MIVIRVPDPTILNLLLKYDLWMLNEKKYEKVLVVRSFKRILNIFFAKINKRIFLKFKKRMNTQVWLFIQKKDSILNMHNLSSNIEQLRIEKN